MTYNHLNALLQGRNNASRKLAHNTYAHRLANNVLTIRLHSTDILTFTPDNNVRYNTGGWRTSTTKQRMNHYGGPGYIYQRNHEWFITYMGETRRYFDGITLATPNAI